MELVTRAEVAKRAGVSRPAIGDAVESKRLRLVGEGRTAKIDLHDKLTVEYIRNNNRQRQKGAEGKPEPDSSGSNGKKTGRKVTDWSQLDLNGIDIADLDLESLEQLDNIDSYAIDKLKSLQDFMVKKIKAQKDRGELIDRKLVQVVLGRLYRVHTNQLKPIGDKIGPKIAAIAELEDPEVLLEINKIIEEDVHAVLEFIKRLFNDFLEEIKGEPIEDAD